jgi:hypothetical protein
MTSGEVLAAFSGEASKDGEAVKIPKLDIAGIEMKAALEFRDGRLWRAVLSAPLEPTMAQFNTLAAELTKKYGPPATQKSEPFDIYQLARTTMSSLRAESSWIAGDTSIELRYDWYSFTDRSNPSSDKDTKTLDLVYSDRAAVSPNL